MYPNLMEFSYDKYNNIYLMSGCVLMNYAYFLTHSREGINKQNYHYSLVKNLTNLPINLFKRFPPVYLLIFDQNNSKEMYSATNIKLSRQLYTVTERDLKFLKEYEEKCVKFNIYIKNKKILKKKLDVSEAIYKYNKHVTKNKNLEEELKSEYYHAKNMYQKTLHFSKSELILIEDLYQYFLYKV